MRKPLPLTLHPTEAQAMAWADGARFLGMNVPAFVVMSASWAAKYFPTQERAKRRDMIALRIEEKQKLGALFQAARNAVQYLPAPFRSVPYGEPRDPAGDLQRAIDAAQEFQEKYSEYWQ